MQQGLVTQAGGNQWKIKEINFNNDADVGMYLDSASMYHIWPKIKGTEDVNILLNSMAKKKMDFLGPKSEVFSLLNKRIVKKDLKGKNTITVYVELPEQENYIEITQLHVVPGTTTVGRRKSPWEMTVRSNNLTNKNLYALVDYPHIQFQPKNQGMPDGNGGYRYEFVVSGGQFDDYINITKLKPGSKFENIGAVREEAVRTRGSVEMRLGGKAFVVYKYPVTKMGFEVNVTDEAHRIGTHFSVEPAGDQKFNEYMGASRFVFSELDVKFKMETEKVFDRYLMIGRGYYPGENYMVDGTTHYPYTLGPSFMDFFRAANQETYYHQSFKIDYILDRIRRQITKMDISDRKGMVVDVMTGDGGWDLLRPELDRMDNQGIIEADWLYGVTEGLDSNRKGVILNKKQVRGLYLDDYGTVIFHNSELLNKGILSGQREVKRGFKLSSYWFIIMISKANDPANPINNAINLYENNSMEGYGVVVGTYTPTGHVMNTTANYRSHDAGMGHMYKIINDMEKGIYVPNMNGLHILYPDIYFKD